MALNVAVPLSAMTERFDGEGCGLLSPISPLDIGFRDKFQILVSPDSESSSGVSSFDSDDSKVCLTNVFLVFICFKERIMNGEIY